MRTGDGRDGTGLLTEAAELSVTTIEGQKVRKHRTYVEGR